MASLLGGGVLGDSLGSFRDSVFGKFSRKEKTDSSLDFPRGDGRPLVVVGEPGSFARNPFEDVIHKGVHDGHGFGRNSSVRVDLFQDLVDVNGIGFLPLVLSLLVPL